MKTLASVIVASACAAAVPAFAQGGIRQSDAVEAKRMLALATVQRLGVSARSQYDPKVATSMPGQKGCTFNIGDVASGQALDNKNALGQPVQRGGLRRTEYVTVVNATPICVQR